MTKEYALPWALTLPGIAAAALYAFGEIRASWMLWSMALPLIAQPWNIPRREGSV